MIFSNWPRFRFYNSLGNLWNIGSFLIRRLTLRAGNETGKTEAEICRYLGIKHCILAPQGRLGIYFGLKALITEEKYEVIVSPYTIYDVINMITLAGGTPVFVDCRYETANIDPNEISAKITKNTCGVIATHLHGLSCEMRPIIDLCKQHNIYLMEDTAQALGVTHDGQKLATLGDIGFLSFGRAKNINAFFGGAMVTNNDKLAADIRADMKNLPQESLGPLIKRILHCTLGSILTHPAVFSLLTIHIFKSALKKKGSSVMKTMQTEANPIRRKKMPANFLVRPTSMQAYLVRKQIAKVDDNFKHRAAIAEIYRKGLKDSNGFMMQVEHEGVEHGYFQFPVMMKNCDELVIYLLERDIDVSIQHLNAVNTLEKFSEFNCSCPNAEKLAGNVILLPTYPGYPLELAKRNVGAINDFFQKHKLPTQ